MKKFIIIFGIIFTSINLLITFGNNKEINQKENISIKKSNFSNKLSMMLETGSNTDKYELTTANEWPTSGYKFNSKLSKCENGGSVSWDFKNKNVVMEGTTSDKCYIYFDKIVTVNEYCSSGDNLADCIKTFGNAGYDTSSIYIHDSSLKNGAVDNSYRFAGASDYVNNYVCFGSDADVCPTDNLYRIIGVFGDQVKLIKADFATNDLLGTDGAYSSSAKYYWNNSTNTNTWSESNLNTVNLNINYLNNIGTTWANMIADTSWKVGGNTDANISSVTAPNAYKNEITSPAESTTDSKKIGLMYASDYGFAASHSAWTTTLYNYNSSSVTAVNWMYSGSHEWTITRSSDNTITAFVVVSSGFVNLSYRTYYYAYGVHPVFYLKNSINYNGGSGTKDSPIRLEKTEATLANYVKSQYTGTQGDNNLYYHNGTITSDDGTVIDANDGSYRYAGSSDTTNNYVCFGSDAETCPTDNLYRIIGVFNDRVKLIKADYATSTQLGTNGAYKATSTINSSIYKGYLTTQDVYRWNTASSGNVWSASNLNTVNLNTNYIAYLKNINSKWTNMIADTTWKVGGNTYTNIAESPIYKVYQKEIAEPAESTTYSAKIGLMYVSDYGYAALPTYWLHQLAYDSNDNDYRVAINDNWMNLGLGDWAITPTSGSSGRAYFKGDGGLWYSNLVDDYSNCILPTFYLNTDVLKISGTGSILEPIRVS